MAQPEFYSPKTLAERIDRSEHTVRYWRTRGEGPAGFRIGRRVVYHRAEVERWLAEQEAASTAAGAA